MCKEKLLFLFFVAVLLTVASAVPRPDDSSEEESKDDDDDDVCSLPAVKPSPVTCLAFLSRWTYKDGACRQIIYGGCGGTKNLFETKDACDAKCNRKKDHSKGSAPKAAAPSPCALPKAAGTCRAIIPSFYFDSASGTCKSFAYTGCKGNANNFISIEDCQKTCNAKMAAVTLPAPVKANVKEVIAGSSSDICKLPPIENTGRACLAFIPSWTFNAKSGKCESYVYGGCGKTANLFKTQEDCQAACGPRNVNPAGLNRESCLLPIAKGPCFGFMKRYAFNMEKNRCELFTYGGCQGNGNNFRTANECFEMCGGALPSLTAECEQSHCPVSNRRYLDRGCRPEYKGNSCCPTSFTCPDHKSSKGVCHYAGIAYQIGSNVSAVTLDQPCKTDCFCVSSTEHQGGATIKCTDTVCPGDLSSPLKEGCAMVTKSNTCCPTLQCHDHSSEEKEVDICIFDGKEYAKGQTIPTGDPCHVCECVRGFQGLDGPGCRNAHCLIDNRIGCAPVYTDNICCPTSYKCAKDSVENNKTRIIRIDGEPGKQGVVTLPIQIPGGNIRKWQVKASRCLLPKDSGPCRMSQPSFYYDGDQLKCLPFLYGGCKGNENRFESEQLCLSACQYSDSEVGGTTPEETKKESTPPIIAGPVVKNSSRPQRCTLPMNAGPCRMSLEMFYFDTEQQDCLSFLYGGCKGNSNQFQTVEECREACRVQPSTASSQVASANNANVCQLPQEVGPCRSQIHAYYYNANSGACEPFWYGGCRGNGNRFETESECQARCVPANTTQPPVLINLSQEIIGSHCKLPADMGPCRASKPRFHFDAASGECQPFQFGGCRGNANNFETIEQCRDECAPESPSKVVQRVAKKEEKHSRCILPADVGFCRSFQERFYYDSVDHQCKTFSWGGCLGNANNFATADECVAACGQLQVKPVALGAARSSVARARARFDEVVPLDPVSENEIVVKDLVCTFGNETMNLGDRVASEDPCEECVCSTPPEITCTRHGCPPPPDMPDGICKSFVEPGKCCPYYGCVSSNPPVIDSECTETCPPPPDMPNGICKTIPVPGKCCPEYGCVSSDPPVIDSCTETCPQPPDMPNGICKAIPVPGKCCPEYGCVSSDPPVIDSCTETCPPPPDMPNAICKPVDVLGRCCPDWACVSANPPFIDVCADVVCKTGEHCQVQVPESPDGSWKEPIGVCVTDAAL